MSVWCNHWWLLYGGQWTDRNGKYINRNAISMSGMWCLRSVTQISYSEVLCINSLSRSKPVNTCATKNTIWSVIYVYCTVHCCDILCALSEVLCHWQIWQWNFLQSEDVTLLEHAECLHHYSLLPLNPNDFHSKSHPLAHFCADPRSGRDLHFPLVTELEF